MAYNFKSVVLCVYEAVYSILNVCCAVLICLEVHKLLNMFSLLLLGVRMLCGVCVCLSALGGSED